MKSLFVLLSIFHSLSAFGFGGGPSNPNEIRYHHTGGGGGGGYGLAPMGVGGSGYGFHNYPEGSIGPFPERPRTQPIARPEARVEPAPIQTPVERPFPSRIYPNHNTTRADRMRQLRLRPSQMDDARENAIRQMVQSGNSCHACDNPNCNEEFLRSNASRICNDYPRCPCNNSCDQDLIDHFCNQYLSQMNDHNRGRTPDGFDYSQQRHREPSPSLSRSFPELVLLPLAQRAFLPIAETIIEIGTSLESHRASFEYPRIETPYGHAVQDMSIEALQARSRVEEGATLYRIGTRGRSNTGNDAQFWSLENPSTAESYAQRYGIPEENMNFDFIERATMRPNSTFITRPAPAVGSNGGGSYEVVIPASQRSITGQGHSSL